MQALGMLMIEHRLIEKMIAILNGALVKIDTARQVIIEVEIWN